MLLVTLTLTLLFFAVLTAGEKQRISVDARVDGGPICNSKKTHGVTYKIKDPSKSLFF
jgi:hypothetical protein